MSDLPRVTIVTPCYNHAEFLEDAIQSVRCQDYGNIEHIIIDGGSTDGSVEIIRKHADRLAYWVSEKDSGQASAINKGFRRASGEIVAWLNSDDMYFPHAVSTAVRLFRERPKVGFVYGDCVFVNRQGHFLRYFTEIEPYSTYRLLNCSDYIMQPASFFRREVLERAGLLDESLHFGLDWDLWCRFATAGVEFHYEQAVLAANREYGTTKTYSGNLERVREITRIWRRHRTSFFPTISLAAGWGELGMAVRRTESRPLKLVNGLMLLVSGTAGLLHLRQGRKQRCLGGFVPRSGRCLQEAEVLVPVFRTNVSKLVICCSCPFREARKEQQRLHISVNGMECGSVEFRGDGFPFVFDAPLPDSVRAGHVVRIGFTFDHGYTKRGRKLGGVIESVLVI